MHKDQIAGFEVEELDGVLILSLELSHGGEAALEDVVADGSEIAFTHLELAGTGGDEFSGGEWASEFRDKKHGHGDIKGKKWLDAVGHVKWGVASGLANSCAVSPKDVGGAGWPL